MGSLGLGVRKDPARIVLAVRIEIWEGLNSCGLKYSRGIFSLTPGGSYWLSTENTPEWQIETLHMVSPHELFWTFSLNGGWLQQLAFPESKVAMPVIFMILSWELHSTMLTILSFLKQSKVLPVSRGGESDLKTQRGARSRSPDAKNMWGGQYCHDYFLKTVYYRMKLCLKSKLSTVNDKQLSSPQFARHSLRTCLRYCQPDWVTITGSQPK